MARPRARARRPAASACGRGPRTLRRSSPRCVGSARRIPDPRRSSSTSSSTSRKSWCGPRGCPCSPTRCSWGKSRGCSAPAVYSSSMPDELEFERPLLELENRIAELRSSEDPQGARDEIHRLEERLRRLQQRVYGSLTPWQRTQLARHPKRPHTLDLFRLLLEDFIELHGDRVFGDDKAIVGGLGRFEGQPVVALGHQKGRDTRENIARNFGMPHPEGYRKALRLMELGAKFAKPILCVVTGEGGSGGALAIGMGNRVLMLEYGVYSVISPEGCAAILWGEATKAPEAAELMRVTAPELKSLGVIDGVVPEPVGGAHRNWEETAANLRTALRDSLWELRSLSPGELIAQRAEKFRRIGVFEESV